jgi:hypothetical protein
LVLLLAHLTIGHRPAGTFRAPATLPVGSPLGFSGTHNRLHSVGALLADLAPGTHEIGVAGLGYPEPAPFGPPPVPTLHQVRLTVLVLNP